MENRKVEWMVDSTAQLMVCLMVDPMELSLVDLMERSLVDLMELSSVVQMDTWSADLLVVL